jgi:hypothetical protein
MGRLFPTGLDELLQRADSCAPNRAVDDPDEVQASRVQVADHLPEGVSRCVDRNLAKSWSCYSIAADNPVRFLDAFVDQLDLQVAPDSPGIDRIQVHQQLRHHPHD